eukprot:1159018-Pelagomonas_calceolata.AAC.5
MGVQAAWGWVRITLREWMHVHYAAERRGSWKGMGMGHMSIVQQGQGGAGVGRDEVHEHRTVGTRQEGDAQAERVILVRQRSRRKSPTGSPVEAASVKMQWLLRVQWDQDRT